MSDLPSLVGEIDAIKNRYTKSISNTGQETTIETYEGRSDKIEALYEIKKLASSEDNSTISLDIQGGDGSMSITTTTPVEEGGGGGGGDDPDNSSITWQVQMQEIMKPIGSHPYFEGTSGAWAETQVLIDQAIKNNTNFNTADSAYPAEASRYFALKTYGVENYPVYQPIIKKTTKTPLKTIAIPSFKGFGFVETLNAINPPFWIVNQLSKLPKLQKGDYNNGDPLTLNINNIQLADYEWLKLPPTVQSTQGTYQYDIVEVWRGAEKWSAVFYGGTWDPTRDL